MKHPIHGSPLRGHLTAQLMMVESDGSRTSAEGLYSLSPSPDLLSTMTKLFHGIWLIMSVKMFFVRDCQEKRKKREDWPLIFITLGYVMLGSQAP